MSFITVLLVLSVLSDFSSATDTLPLAANLQKDAHEVERLQIPLLVFYSSHSCDYCRTVEEMYLSPMYNSGEYKDKVIFRIVRTESAKPLREFSGSWSDHSEFSRRQGAGFVPLIRFYDHRGREVAEEIRGYSSPDFYAGYLEQAIESSHEQIRAQLN